MAEDFLSGFMGSASRTRVLRVFMFDPNVLTLQQVTKRSGVPARAAEKEIRVLQKWGIIKKGKFSILLANGEKRVVTGKQKMDAWAMNPNFKHASALLKFVHEVSPVHYKGIVEGLKSSGRLATVFLSGTFLGAATRAANLIIAADALNEKRLEAAVKALEPQLGREIRYAAFSIPEFRYRLTIQDRLLRDTLDYPHLILLDKTRLL